MEGTSAAHTAPRNHDACMTSRCPACHHGSLEQFYEVRDVPANSCILFSSESDARRCIKSDIALTICEECGFIFNAKFSQEKTEYSGRYEETQAFSGTFNRFHCETARRLVDRHDLYGKDIIEIGCGKGEFLVQLAELGGNHCLGVDPGVHQERLPQLQKGSVRCLAEYYSEKCADERVDLIVCKMTLEHIPDVGVFVATVRRSLGRSSKAVVFFQIPEATRILRECAFEDVYHEHCSYFTPGSLSRLFRRCGFDVLEVETAYGGQYLMIEARPSSYGSDGIAAGEDDYDPRETIKLASSFAERVAKKQSEWRSIINDADMRGMKTVIWGSGSKAVSFLGSVDRGSRIRYVTDVNPYRHNHFMPLSGQRIMPPSELATLRPDLVIAMNRIYRDEIGAELKKMGLSSELRCL